MDSEGIGQGMDVVEADVALAALDTPHVGTMEAGPIGKRLL